MISLHFFTFIRFNYAFEVYRSVLIEEKEIQLSYWKNLSCDVFSSLLIESNNVRECI